MLYDRGSNCVSYFAMSMIHFVDIELGSVYWYCFWDVIRTLNISYPIT